MLRIYTAAAKAVLPEIKDGETVDQIIDRLNAMSLEAALRPSTYHSEPAPSKWGLGRLWGETAKPARAASTEPLPKLHHLHIASPVAKRSSAGSSKGGNGPATAPATPDRTASPEPIVGSDLGTPSLVPRSADTSASIPSWRGDDMAELVVGGSAFGAGLFELVFAMMPPKAKRAMSWFGYAAGSRKTGLKLLAVAAAGTDVHACVRAIRSSALIEQRLCRLDVAQLPRPRRPALVLAAGPRGDPGAVHFSPAPRSRTAAEGHHLGLSRGASNPM